ncbi:hypothetical protein [Gimesia sp.]|uniref:hypothetical protein n=1 Tax=Gimesia sp. TaxID=2024833 RepID=UPI003A8DA5CA
MKWISWKPALFSGIGLTISVATLTMLIPANADERSPSNSRATSNDIQSDLLAQVGKRDDSSRGKSQSGKPENRSGDKPQSGKPGNRSSDKPQSGKPGNRSSDRPQSGNPGNRSGDRPQSGNPGNRSGDRPQSDNPGNRSGDRPQSRNPGNRSGDRPQSRNPGNRSSDRPQSRETGNRFGGIRSGGIHAPANIRSRQNGISGRQQPTISRSPSFSRPNINRSPNVVRQPRDNTGRSINTRSDNIIRNSTQQNLNLSRDNVSGRQRGSRQGLRDNDQRGAWSHSRYRDSQYTNRQFSGNTFHYGDRNFRLSQNTYRPAYYRHSGYHGYWNYNRGFGTGYYGYGSGYGYGNNYGYRPLGWGLGGWGLGSFLYSSGYLGYSNPYYVNSGTTVYNYSQPILVSTEPVDTDENPMDEVINNAVAAFQQEDYNAALDIINKGITQYPDDAVFHEFRALVLFARGDYQQAAATIHAVLAVGPGWDWTTLSSFYIYDDTYTGQLRALEAAPQDAATRFLLAYHYLCCGHDEAAADQLRIVVQLKPNDHVAIDMLKMLAPSQPDPQRPTTLKPSPASPQASVKSIDPEMLVGTWQATRPDGAQFELTLAKPDKFIWSFTPPNQPAQKFDGNYTVEKNVLALEGEKVGSLIGEVTPGNGNTFNFKILGAPSDDPGLTFKQ